MPQVDGPIDIPDRTWSQVLELAARDWRSAREQISWLLVTGAEAAIAERKTTDHPVTSGALAVDRQLVNVGVCDDAA